MLDMNKEYYENTGIKSSLMEEIFDYARKYQVEKVILFGSRARGDYKRTSDIDLAFVGGDKSRFTLAVNEDTRTLLEFDIVDLQEPVQEELRASIYREGMVVYEKV